jgi:hypothetical protein
MFCAIALRLAIIRDQQRIQMLHGLTLTVSGLNVHV